MPNAPRQNAETGIFVKVGPNASGLPLTDGWQTLRIGTDEDEVRREFTRQAAIVAAAGGEAVLGHVVRHGVMPSVTPLIDHRGNKSPRSRPTYLPVSVSDTLRDRLRPQARKPVRRRSSNHGLTAALACMFAVGAGVGTLLASGWMDAPAQPDGARPANAAYETPLAAGGSVRRLQGVAEAFGKRY